MKFKEGMKVVVCSRYDERLSIVEEVTKGGNVRVNKSLYLPSGWLRGADKWCVERIRPATEKDIEEFRQKNVIRRCKYALDHLELTYPLAVEILKTINEYMNRKDANKDDRAGKE